jgi:hypothetical protein
MPVVGYEPAPPGMPGYHFQLDDGSKQYLYGQQADDLARYIDQTKPPDARLAANGPGTFGTPAALRPPDIGYDPANPMGGLPKFEAPAPAASAAPPSVPAQQDAGTTPPPAPPPPQEEESIKYRYSGGTAAVDPRKMAANAVPVPVSETVSGAIPETPEQHEERVKRQEASRAEYDVAAADMRAASADMVAAREEERTAALNRTIKADIDQKEAEKTLLAAKSAADAKWSEIQKENQAAAAQKIDPNRLFHGQNGAAVAIVSAIASGLGAFGGAMSRSPNYAQQIIQGAIDRDIAAQTDTIHRRGEAARNAVADYARTYGLTLEEAKLGVKSTQLRYAASMADISAARIGTADAKQKAALINMDLTKQSEALAAQMREMYEGRVTKHFADVQPSRGSRGGWVPVSREQTIKTGTNPEERKARSEERVAQTIEDKNVQDYGKQKNAIEEAKTALKDYTETIGGAPQADGSVKWRDIDIPDTGLLGGTTPAISEEARNVEQKREWLRARVGKVLSGASVSPTQEKQIMSLITSTNEETARRGVELLQGELSRMSNTNDAAFGPKVVTQFEDNNAQLSGERRKRTEGGPRPAGVIK